jgi:hypothetical protein
LWFALLWGFSVAVLAAFAGALHRLLRGFSN